MCQLKNRVLHTDRSMPLKVLLIAVFGLLFWGVVFFIFYRVLIYFKGIDVLGVFLATKLLSMILLTLFSILVFSTIITAISTLFMSEELQLIVCSPYDMYELFFEKFAETVFNSSWMALLFSLPVFLSYGMAFASGVMFYIVLFMMLLPFIIISCSIGIGCALLLVSVFPVRRLKDMLFLLSIFLAIGLYMLFRLIRPERLVDPDSFFTVLDYLSSLEMPTSPLLPSQWAADVLEGILFRQSSLTFELLLLWVSAGAAVFVLNKIFNSIFTSAWSKTQEARTAKITKNRFYNRLIESVFSRLPQHTRAIIDKDLRIFFRDTAQWSQLFILAAIIVIYLYNFSVLPFDKSPIPTVQLQNLIAFINLGLAGFVISAVAVRFSYPAISLEGESFWIVRSSPLSIRGLVWCKFFMNFIMLAVLSEILIVLSNYFLHAEPFMMVLSSITILLMTLGLTSLSIGFGALFPRFRYENVAQIPTGFGGFMYMAVSVIYIGSIVVLEAWPVHLLIMSRMRGTELDGMQIFGIAASFVLILIISAAVCILPLYKGLGRLERLESY